MNRILASFFVFLSAFYLPWYIFLIAIFLCIIFFENYYEAFFMAFLLDFLYTDFYKISFENFKYFFIIFSFWIFIFFLKKNVKLK